MSSIHKGAARGVWRLWSKPGKNNHRRLNKQFVGREITPFSRKVLHLLYTPGVYTVIVVDQRILRPKKLLSKQFAKSNRQVGHLKKCAKPYVFWCAPPEINVIIPMGKKGVPVLNHTRPSLSRCRYRSGATDNLHFCSVSFVLPATILSRLSLLSVLSGHLYLRRVPEPGCW